MTIVVCVLGRIKLRARGLRNRICDGRLARVVRPVDVAIATDGSLIDRDDGSNSIWQGELLRQEIADVRNARDVAAATLGSRGRRRLCCSTLPRPGGVGEGRPTRSQMIGWEIYDKFGPSTGVLTREESVHSRTAVLLKFSISLPSVEARGRWRERGRIGWERQSSRPRSRTRFYECAASTAWPSLRLESITCVGYPAAKTAIV